VLDEPDDFDLGDLPALSRLVHWCGMLGSRVLLSSATLPPSFVEGLFEAYSAGRETFQANRGALGQPLAITSAWFDEFGCQSLRCANATDFRSEHGRFVAKRLDRLGEQTQRRHARIVPIVSDRPDRTSVCRAVAKRIPDWIAELHHRHHSVDPGTAKRVSFGLIRMANIAPLIEVAESLFEYGAPPELRIHLCVYHARHPLLMRSAIERMLDRTLQRSNEHAVFETESVRAALDASSEHEHAFVVLASPVAEVVSKQLV
jgi:CRISPR-associated endonuclease/helicase Cas3